MRVSTIALLRPTRSRIAASALEKRDPAVLSQKLGLKSLHRFEQFADLLVEVFVLETRDVQTEPR